MSPKSAGDSFIDTSALGKHYVVEEGSEITQLAAKQSEVLAASRIAWAEYHAAVQLVTASYLARQSVAKGKRSDET